MPNGFDFVDQLFSGFIAFVYNLVETATRLLVRPSRAPAQLLRRCRHPATRQISGITCLALSAAGALMLTMPKVPSLRVAGVDLRTLVPTVEGQVRLATIMPFLIGGIAAAIVIDASIRSLLAVFRLPRARRPDLAARLAYAFSFFPIALSIYVAVFRFTPWLDGLVAPAHDGSGAELLVPMLVLLRGCQLVGTTAVHATMPASQRTRRASIGKALAGASVFVIFAAALVGAVVAAAIANRAPATGPQVGLAASRSESAKPLPPVRPEAAPN